MAQPVAAQHSQDGGVLPPTPSRRARRSHAHFRLGGRSMAALGALLRSKRAVARGFVTSRSGSAVPRLSGAAFSPVLSCFSQQVSGGCTAARPRGRAASGDSSKWQGIAGAAGDPSPAEPLTGFSPRRQGLAANPSGYGPLTELPDWSYAGERLADT